MRTRTLPLPDRKSPLRSCGIGRLWVSSHGLPSVLEGVGLIYTPHKGTYMEEFFISPKEAAAFLCITERHLLSLARAKKLPGHPISWGKKNSRSQWRFFRSELHTWMLGLSSTPVTVTKLGLGPEQQPRNNNGRQSRSRRG
jgi:hypothetical protein